MKIKQLIPFVLLIATLPAMAATSSGVAKFKSQDKGGSASVTFEFLNESTSRLNMSADDDTDSYLLSRDGKTYIVAKTSGQTIVMDMADLQKMASNFGADTDQHTESFTANMSSMKATGKSETVAGINGEVYRLEWSENGKKRVDDLVITHDKRAVAYTRAWMNSIKNIETAEPGKKVKGDELFSMLFDKKLGLLRLGDRFMLVSVKLGKQDADRFNVPAATMAMPKLDGLFGGSKGSPSPTTGAAAATVPAETESSGGVWGKFKDKFKQKSDRQVERQKSRTDDVIDQATDEATDKAIEGTVTKTVDKVFGKLFGK